MEHDFDEIWTATLKAIGFSGSFVAVLIVAESLAIALVGGVLGVAATLPLADAFAATVGTLFASIVVSRETIALQILAAAAVGLVAAVWPAWRAARLRIVDGLRAVV